MSESEAESKVKSYDLNEVKPGALGHFARPGWWGPFAEQDDGWRWRYRLTADPRVEATEAPAQPGVTPTEPEPEHLADSDVAHPAHYNKGTVECVDAIESAVQGLDPVSAVLVAPIIKYVWRHAHKGTPVKDLEKASWYLERLTRHVAAKEAK